MTESAFPFGFDDDCDCVLKHISKSVIYVCTEILCDSSNNREMGTVCPALDNAAHMALLVLTTAHMALS